MDANTYGVALIELIAVRTVDATVQFAAAFTHLDGFALPLPGVAAQLRLLHLGNATACLDDPDLLDPVRRPAALHKTLPCCSLPHVGERSRIERRCVMPLCSSRRSVLFAAAMRLSLAGQ